MTDHDIIKNKIYSNTSNIIEFVYKYMWCYCNYGHGWICSNDNITSYCSLLSIYNNDCCVCTKFDIYDYSRLYMYIDNKTKSFTSTRPYGSYFILSIGIII